MTATTAPAAPAHERRRRRLRGSSPWRQPNLAAYLARTRNIDELIATGDLPDPFYGNYRVVPVEQALVIAPDRDERFAIEAFSSQVVAGSGGIYRPMPIAESTFGDPRSGRRMDLVTADFDGDGRDEILWASDTTTGVRLQVGRVANGAVQPAGELELPIAPAGQPVLVAGGFHIDPGAGSSTPDAVLGWVDANGQVRLDLFEVTPDLQIHARASAVDGTARAPTSTIALAAGDLVGDGAQALVAVSPTPLALRVAVYSVDVTGGRWALTRRADWASEPIADEGRVSVTCADFDYDAADEVAVAWEAPGRGLALRLIAADDDYTLVPKGRYDDAVPLAGKGWLAVAGGVLGVSLPAGGQQERPEPSQIALGFEIAGHLLQVRVIESDSALALGPRAVKSSRVLGQQIGYRLITDGLRLQVAAIGGGAVNAIVVGVLGSSGNPWTVSTGLRTLTVGLAGVTPDLAQITPLEPETCHVDAGIRDRSGSFSFALATGDLTGASLRVGPPRSRQASAVSQVLAVLNAPPTHVVKIDGKDEINLNFDGGSYVTFQNSQHEQTTVQFQTTKNWGYSKEVRKRLEAPLFGFESSLTTKYGENFERVTDEATAYTFASSVPALWQEDQAVLMTTDYTVWEYDVLDGASGAGGPMAVVFPATSKPDLVVEGTKRLDAHYTPDHFVGNVLSYRKFGQLPPECDAADIVYQVRRDIGVSATDDALTWQTTSGDAENRRKEQSLSVSESGRISPQFRGITFGIGVQLDGEYSETEFTSTQSTIQQTTNIGVAFVPFGDPGQQAWMYRVQPVWYWAREWGYLALDYMVDAPEDPIYPSRWQREYTLPDLAFALPYASLGPEYTYLTRDLICTPVAGGDVAITGVVRNFSLVDATNVEVRLFHGDPDAGNVIATVVVVVARARQATPFSATWVRPLAGLHDVWAVIDPDDAVPDLYRQNNRGWTRVTV